MTWFLTSPYKDVLARVTRVYHLLSEHRQLNRRRNVFDATIADSAVSIRLLNTGLLPPDPERFRARAPVVRCGHEMAPWPRMSVDEAVRGEKVLHLARKFKLLHLSLSSSRRPEFLAQSLR